MKLSSTVLYGISLFSLSSAYAALNQHAPLALEDKSRKMQIEDLVFEKFKEQVLGGPLKNAENKLIAEVLSKKIVSNLSNKIGDKEQTVDLIRMLPNQVWMKIISFLSRRDGEYKNLAAAFPELAEAVRWQENKNGSLYAIPREILKEINGYLDTKSQCKFAQASFQLRKDLGQTSLILKPNIENKFSTLEAFPLTHDPNVPLLPPTLRPEPYERLWEKAAEFLMNNPNLHFIEFDHQSPYAGNYTYRLERKDYYFNKVYPIINNEDNNAENSYYYYGDYYRFKIASQLLTRHKNLTDILVSRVDPQQGEGKSELIRNREVHMIRKPDGSYAVYEIVNNQKGLEFIYPKDREHFFD